LWDHFLPAAEADYSQAKKKWAWQKKKAVSVDSSLEQATLTSAVAAQMSAEPTQRKKQEKLPEMPKPRMQHEEIRLILLLLALMKILLGYVLDEASLTCGEGFLFEYLMLYKKVSLFSPSIQVIRSQYPFVLDIQERCHEAEFPFCNTHCGTDSRLWSSPRILDIHW